MGGSLALSLKERCRHLSAYDPDRSTLELARRQEIVHRAESDPAEILTDADLVILACPVPDIIDWLARLTEYVQHPCIVLDIGSSKRTIVAALETLPANFDPLGGHPICGRERLSLENAERFLYRDAPFVLTPLERTSENARSAALQIVEALGAHPIWLDANAHDRILAATSHLPYLLSSALVLATTEEAAPLIGPGFRSTSRLAATPSSMMLGVLMSNRDNLIDAIGQLQDQMATIKFALMASDANRLKSVLNTAKTRHQQLDTDH